MDQCIRLSWLYALLLVLFSSSQGNSSVLRVPSQFINVQNAINVADEGDTVLLAPGVYSGHGFRNITFLQKNVVLTSENGPESTVLDFGSDSVESHRGIFITRGQTRESVIDGLTLRGGSYEYGGAALICGETSPTIKNCIFVDNYGSVIDFWSGSPFFENCTIVRNKECSPGAIRMANSTPIFRNCIIAHNFGAPAFFFSGSFNQPTIECCVIYGNEGGDWVGAIANWIDSSGNISVDPRLCDPETYDLHLRADSPCRPDAGSCDLIGALNVGCIDGTNPFATAITISPVDSNGNLTSQSLVISWNYLDTSNTTQSGYIVHIVADVGEEGNVFWADTAIGSTENKVVYNGLQLNSHATYYCRVKLGNEHGWGPWRELTFFTHLDVKFGVPISQPTIQEAINVAFEGDTIVVYDGVYTGKMNRNISFLGKSITVRSQHGPAYTIIDAERTYQTRVFLFDSEEDNATVLDGFTITGGSIADHNTYGGAGVACVSSSPLIRNCVFKNNNSLTTHPLGAVGGGASFHWSSAILENCTFINNSAIWGGAIYTASSDITLRRCNIVFSDRGGALLVTNSGTSYVPKIDCTNIYGNNGGDWTFPFVPYDSFGVSDLSFDPLICDYNRDTYRVNENSPCLPTNNVCGVLIGAVDSACLSTDITDEPTHFLPNSFSLGQNYPNPFNPLTQIEYSLPRRAHVQISIYNTLGQLVKTVVNSEQTAGIHSVTWDGKDELGRTVSSGIYFYKLSASDFVESKKMLLLK